MFELNGKSAIVTGAGRGIGKAVALGLARAGAEVGLVARSRDELELVAEEVRSLGRRTKCISADLTQVRDLPAIVAQMADALGQVDILVNNAGINIPQEALDVDEESWNRIMDINLKAAFFMAQAVGKVMIEQGRGGRIINVSSQTGSVALIKRSAYCASKAGLNLITKVLALEWARYDIRVNAVAPTFVETEMSKGYLADPEFRQYALSKNLLKRFGTTEDVAGAVIFLSAPASSLVTGHILMVDAGWTAY